MNQVTSSNGHTLFSKEDAAKGKFAFTTEDNDVFEICFDNQLVSGGHAPDREVYLDVKRGVEAKSYEGVSTQRHDFRCLFLNFSLFVFVFFVR